MGYSKFSSFLLYPWKLHMLNHPPSFCFFHYSVFTVISDCNRLFDTSTFTHTVSQEYIIAIENTYLNGVFLKSKISIFHKRNLNPKVLKLIFNKTVCWCKLIFPNYSASNSVLYIVSFLVWKKPIQLFPSFMFLTA